jgi:molecular chaperone GrpE (heat shock protein)
MSEETLYTYFKIEFEDTSIDYDYTIVENIEDVIDYLKSVEIDLDDDERKSKIIITGVPMTRAQFSEWFKDNVESTA